MGKVSSTVSWAFPGKSGPHATSVIVERVESGRVLQMMLNEYLKDLSVKLLWD